MFNFNIHNRGGGSMQKVGELKYLAPNINVYILMILTAFSLNSGEGGWGFVPQHLTSDAVSHISFHFLRNTQQLILRQQQTVTLNFKTITSDKINTR